MLLHASGATAIKSSGHLPSSALAYLLLLVDCSIAPASTGTGCLLSVYQTQSDDGKYGAAEADMG
jgi:hypothetical protein